MTKKRNTRQPAPGTPRPSWNCARHLVTLLPWIVGPTRQASGCYPKSCRCGIRDTRRTLRALYDVHAAFRKL
jgi:hypothetical protein